MTKKPWHPYVFDSEQRRFVGDFEGMYEAELREGFDSWHQSDLRRLDSRVAELLLDYVDFQSALDLGCGKGGFTALLAREATTVTGVDVSETAIRVARKRFPEIEWICAPVGEHLENRSPVDLIVARELLSYLEDWRQVLARCANVGRYLLAGLYVPPDPIGFVKSHADLEAELQRNFKTLESVMLVERRIGVYLCESRARSRA